MGGLQPREKPGKVSKRLSTWRSRIRSQVDSRTYGNSKLLLINLVTETRPGKRWQGQVPLSTYYRQEHVETDYQNKNLFCYRSIGGFLFVSSDIDENSSRAPCLAQEFLYYHIKKILWFM